MYIRVGNIVVNAAQLVHARTGTADDGQRRAMLTMTAGPEVELVGDAAERFIEALPIYTPVVAEPEGEASGEDGETAANPEGLRDAALVEGLRAAWAEAEPGDGAGLAWERFAAEYERAYGYAPGYFEAALSPGEAARRMRAHARELRPPFGDEGYLRRAEACERRARLLCPTEAGGEGAT